MAGETKMFRYRSRILQLPHELLVKLAEISYQKQMFATQRKNLVIETLREYGTEFTELGTGTNRFIIKYDGFALKIALDQEGVADNKQEYVMSRQLAPDVAATHDISRGGHLLVATYAPAFTSLSEMRMFETQIRAILRKWSTRFLLGDVGLTSVNYANWGVLNGRPVCIDYAYIFPANMALFKCSCGNQEMTFTGNDYTTYQCLSCKKTWTDRELRSRISNEERMRLFTNVSDRSIEMRHPVEEHLATVQIPDEYNPSAPDENLVKDMVVRKMNGLGWR